MPPNTDRFTRVKKFIERSVDELYPTRNDTHKHFISILNKIEENDALSLASKTKKEAPETEKLFNAMLVLMRKDAKAQHITTERTTENVIKHCLLNFERVKNSTRLKMLRRNFSETEAADPAPQSLDAKKENLINDISAHAKKAGVTPPPAPTAISGISGWLRQLASRLWNQLPGVPLNIRVSAQEIDSAAKGKHLGSSERVDRALERVKSVVEPLHLNLKSRKDSPKVNEADDNAQSPRGPTTK